MNTVFEYRVISGYVGNPTNDVQFAEKITAAAAGGFFLQKLALSGASVIAIVLKATEET